MILYPEIRALSDDYEQRLKKQIDARTIEMDDDDKAHYVLYQVLGITPEEGKAIDLYQNKGRFLYKYAGSFLEAATRICIVHKHPDAITTAIRAAPFAVLSSTLARKRSSARSGSPARPIREMSSRVGSQGQVNGGRPLRSPRSPMPSSQ